MKIKKSWIILAIVGVVLIIAVGGGCSTYNGMVLADTELQKSWDNVQNQYQRRYDMYDNLVNTVKGYAAHESGTLEAVTNARAGLTQAADAARAEGGSPADVAQYQAAQDNLSRAFNVYVNAVTEAYPDLKANENFLSLQDEIAGTENRIATERTRYNEAVQQYNLKVRTFPNNIFAGMFGFTPKEGFKADAAAQSAPRIVF